jgi:hypothetical protein
MKKLFTVGVAILFVSLTGFAQQRKGKWLVGGSVHSFTQNHETLNPAVENRSNQLSVNPKVGYFFADRWAVGLAPGFSVQNQKDSVMTIKGRGYNLAAFLRYYQPIGEKLAIFGELQGVTFASGNTTRTYNNGPLMQKNTYNYLGIGAFIQPGIVYFITPKIGLETSFGGLNLGYSRNKNTNEAPGTKKMEGSSNNFTASLNFSYQFNLGVLFYLGR